MRTDANEHIQITLDVEDRSIVTCHVYAPTAPIFSVERMIIQYWMKGVV